MKEIKRHVDRAIRHLDAVNAHQDLAEDEPPFRIHVRQAWKELQGAFDALEEEDGVPSLEEQRATSEVHAEVRLKLAKARLHEAQAREIERRTRHPAEKRSAEDLPAIVRGTSRIDPSDPSATLTEIIQEILGKVDDLLTQDHPVSRWGRRVEARLERLEDNLDVEEMNREAHTVRSWFLQIEQRIRELEQEREV